MRLAGRVRLISTMLETICIRSQRAHDSERPLDLGFLAEALLYYGRVRLILTPGILHQLVVMCGLDSLLRLVQEPDVDTYYLNGGSAVLTQNSGAADEEHRPLFYQLPDWDLERFATKEFQVYAGRTGKGRRMANNFIDHVRSVDVSPEILDRVVSDWANREFIERVAACLLEMLAPDYRAAGRECRFEVLEKRLDHAGTWSEVRTNVDWNQATRAWQRRSGLKNELNPAFVLDSALKVQENLYFASLFSADLAVDAVSSRLIEEKCSELLLTRRGHAAQVADFQLNVTGSAHSLAEAINAGHRSIPDLLDLLDRARPFREWVTEQEPDESLLRTYILAISSISWVQRLPPKTLRWAFVTALGALGGPPGLVAGAALGFLDTLLTERLLGGWKPNRFVDDHLQPFVGGSA